jgi:hypothetical protein
MLQQHIKYSNSELKMECILIVHQQLECIIVALHINSISVFHQTFYDESMKTVLNWNVEGLIVLNLEFLKNGCREPFNTISKLTKELFEPKNLFQN